MGILTSIALELLKQGIDGSLSENVKSEILRDTNEHVLYIAAGVRVKEGWIKRIRTGHIVITSENLFFLENNKITVSIIRSNIIDIKLERVRLGKLVAITSMDGKAIISPKPGMFKQKYNEMVEVLGWSALISPNESNKK